MIKAALDPDFLGANCSRLARIGIGRDVSDLQNESGNVHENAGWKEKTQVSITSFTVAMLVS